MLGHLNGKMFFNTHQEVTVEIGEAGEAGSCTLSSAQRDSATKKSGQIQANAECYTVLKTILILP